MSQIPEPPSKYFLSFIANRWWHVRGKQRGIEEHDVHVSSLISILAWLLFGLALMGFAVWLWQVFGLFSLIAGILALSALGTAFGKWRDNQWLRPPGTGR